MYPPTQKASGGKLRFMYEAKPLAVLVERAGGKAFTGRDDDGNERRFMELQPTDIHERCPVILGSPDEVDQVMRQA